MNKIIVKRKFSRVAIIAGMPSSDWKGAKIIQSIHKNQPSTTFFGVGGSQMQANGLKSFAKLELISDKPFYPIFHFDVDPRFYLNLAMLTENLRLIGPLRELNQNKFWENFEGNQLNDVDMMVTIDNQLLSFRMFEKLSKISHANSMLPPLRVHFDKTLRSYKWDYLRSIDYLFYTLPLPSNDPQLFKYPSQFIGKQVIYDALRYIYSNSSSHAKLLKQNYFFGDLNNSFYLIRDFKSKLRAEVRKEKNLSESTYLFFISPGDLESEIILNARLAVSGIRKFIQNQFSKRDYAVIVNLPEKIPEHNWIIEDFRSLEIPVKFIYGNQQNERYNVMAASDVAAIAKGDSVFEAAAFHLPCVIMDTNPSIKGYLDLMYNVWSSEINWVANGELYPELTIRNFASKLAEFWTVWEEKPELKVDIAKRIHKHLFSLLPSEKDLNFGSGPSEKSNSDFKVCLNPNLVAEKCLEKIRADFQEIRQKSRSVAEFENKRKEWILGTD